MHQRLVVIAIVGLCAGLLGCRSEPRQTESPPPPTKQASELQPARYDLKGKVVAVDKAGKRVTVDHEAIPGFMGAMTMAYPVKDEHLLDNLAAGDQVTAKVVANGADYWLEDIAKK
jgi:protein SCO1/2